MVSELCSLRVARGRERGRMTDVGFVCAELLRELEGLEGRSHVCKDE